MAKKMIAQDIAEDLRKKRGYSQSKVAEDSGFNLQSNYGAWINSKSMRVDNFIRILRAMGCQLIVKTRESIKDPITGQDTYPSWEVALESDTDREVFEKQKRKPIRKKSDETNDGGDGE